MGNQIYIYIYIIDTQDFCKEKELPDTSFVSRNLNWTNKLIVLKTREGGRIRHKKESTSHKIERTDGLFAGFWYSRGLVRRSEEGLYFSTSAFATASLLMLLLLQLQVGRRVSFHWFFFFFFYFSSLFLYFCMHQPNFL